MQASTLPTVSSNDNFAYGTNASELGSAFFPLILAPNGLIEENWSLTEIDPTPKDPWDAGCVPCYEPVFSKADPANHLAVLLWPMASGASREAGYGGSFQLASYTVNNKTGGIASTNTWQNMPIPRNAIVNNMNMSPSGKLLALCGTQGLELFHFNGAAPITTYGGVLLPAINIDQLGWDNNNHLYALSYASQKLFVYTVTPTSITSVAGSPYSVPTAYGVTGMIVVPK